MLMVLLVRCSSSNAERMDVSERPWLNPAVRYNAIADGEGNVYPTVVIGGREWMAENLRSTSYQNGDTIAHLNNSDRVTTRQGGCSQYGHDTSTTPPFGLLYNGYAVMDPRNVCPAGWHVPTDEEWGELELSVGLHQWEVQLTGIRGEHEDIGSQLKTVNYWDTLNATSTDRLGFSGLPAGVFDGLSGYARRGEHGTWWSSSEQGRDSLMTRSLTTPMYHYVDPVVGDVQLVISDKVGVIREAKGKIEGYSVRCVKDPSSSGTRAWDIVLGRNDQAVNIRIDTNEARSNISVPVAAAVSRTIRHPTRTLEHPLRAGHPVLVQQAQ